MADKIESAKLNYHVAIIAVTAAAISDGSVSPKYGARRIQDEVAEICDTANLAPVAVTISAPTGNSTSLEVD